MQQQAIQQQMQNQVTVALAMGRPIPAGTRLMSQDGAVGVVTSNNTVTVTYPSAFSAHRPQPGQDLSMNNINFECFCVIKF